MSTMNVSLPEDLKDFVDEQVSEGSYGTSSEYVRELIRRDRDRLKLRKMILEGLSSPIAGPPDAKFWRKRRELANRHKRRS